MEGSQKEKDKNSKPTHNTLIAVLYIPTYNSFPPQKIHLVNTLTAIVLIPLQCTISG